MPRQRYRIGAVATVLAMAAGTTGASAAAGPAAGEAGPATGEPVVVNGSTTSAPATVHRGETPASATVTLVTGDRIRLDQAPDGRYGVTVLPTAGAAESTMVQFGWNGDQYVIPTEAVPFLGGALDIRLFNVSYLVRAKLDDAHSRTLPVTVRGTATGPFARSRSKSDAPGLGRLLAREWRTGRLPGGTSVRLAPPAGAPPAPTAPPLAAQSSQPVATTATGRPYHTLTLDPIDHNGQPGVMVGFAHNVDDSSLAYLVVNVNPVQRGPLRISVPEGVYSVEISVMTGPAEDLTVDSALVVEPEVRVSADTTVTLDARRSVPFHANLDPGYDAPQRQDMLTFTRTAETGPGAMVQAFGFDGAFALIGMHLASAPETGNQMLYAVPTTRTASVGRFDFAAFTQLAGDPAAPVQPPTYRLAFPYQGRIPTSLTHTVPRSALTTVDSHLYNTPSIGDERPWSILPMVYLPWAMAHLGVAADNIAPGDRTDYWYSSVPELTLWQTVFTANDGTQRWGPRRTIQPGQHIDETWNKAPLAPPPVAPFLQSAEVALFGSAEPVDRPLWTICPACRQGDYAMTYLMPFGDSDPAHFVPLLDGPSSVDFYRDGTLVQTSRNVPASMRVTPYAMGLPLVPEPSTYRLEWTRALKVGNSPSTRTAWTFRSSAADPAAPLPETESCSPDPGRACSFLPLLFLTYDLALDFQSRAPAGGPFEVAFAVRHQPHQATPTGVAATVSVSFDDGHTWTETQAATPSDGNTFHATVQHPPVADTNGFVALRVQAHDAAGNAVDQTIIRAYGLV